MGGRKLLRSAAPLLHFLPRMVPRHEPPHRHVAILGVDHLGRVPCAVAPLRLQVVGLHRVANRSRALDILRLLPSQSSLPALPEGHGCDARDRLLCLSRRWAGDGSLSRLRSDSLRDGVAISERLRPGQPCSGGQRSRLDSRLLGHQLLPGALPRDAQGRAHQRSLDRVRCRLGERLVRPRLDRVYSRVERHVLGGRSLRRSRLCCGLFQSCGLHRVLHLEHCSGQVRHHHSRVQSRRRRRSYGSSRSELDRRT